MVQCNLKDQHKDVARYSCICSQDQDPLSNCNCYVQQVASPAGSLPNNITLLLMKHQWQAPKEYFQYYNVVYLAENTHFRTTFHRDGVDYSTNSSSGASSLYRQVLRQLGGLDFHPRKLLLVELRTSSYDTTMNLGTNILGFMRIIHRISRDRMQLIGVFSLQRDNGEHYMDQFHQMNEVARAIAKNLGIPFFAITLEVEVPTDGFVSYPARWQVNQNDVWKRPVFNEEGYITTEYFRRFSLELQLFISVLRNYQITGKHPSNF